VTENDDVNFLEGLKMLMENFTRTKNDDEIFKRD